MNFKNAHALWSAVFMRTLRNCGVRLLAFAPDAALSPLADAAAETPRLDAVPAPDARAAGFFALGSAKSAAKPTALLCVAGTSDADCLAAVAEARFSRAPLLVIRAERATELVPAGAETERGGPFPSFFAPEKILVPAAGLAAIEEARDAAVCAVRACAENGAPVFVRVRFRDARFPFAAEKNFSRADVPAGFDADAFCRVPPPPMREFLPLRERPPAPAPTELRGKKILIVAGTPPVGRDDAFNADLVSRRFAAPILADATHPLRHFPPARERLIERFDAIFKTAGKPYAPPRDALRPDVVLQIGALPRSASLRAWLASLAGTPAFVFSACGGGDALPGAADTGLRFCACWNEVFFRGETRGAAAERSPEQETFLAAWKEADARFRAKSDAYFRNASADAGTPTEPQIARFLCGSRPESETAIFVAGDAPVRDVNAFCPAGSRFWVFGNGDAASAAGALASAFGAAHGCMEQTLFYTDAPTLLRGAEAFSLAPRFCGNLAVVLQNGGGNAAPDFEKLAAAYGVDYARAGTLAELGAQLARLRSRLGAHLIEIRTDAETSRRLRAELSC